MIRFDPFSFLIGVALAALGAIGGALALVVALSLH